MAHDDILHDAAGWAVVNGEKLTIPWGVSRLTTLVGTSAFEPLLGATFAHLGSQDPPTGREVSTQVERLYRRTA